MLLLLALNAHAQPVPLAHATTTDDPIVVDGALTEPAWADAPVTTGFLQYTPTEGGAPPGHTEVRVLQDDTALYVGVRVTGAGYPIRARVSARERINADDQIGVYLDTFHDGRSGYIFYLNPLGIQQDIRHNSGDWNVNWDTAFRSAGRLLDDGYEIELALPWRSLKFPGTDEAQTWGLIVTRKVPHLGTKYAWPDISVNKPLLFSEAGDLSGVRPPSGGSGLELIPSLTAYQLWSVDEQTGQTPDFSSLDLDPWWRALRPSLDLRLGLTPDLGLAATGNPDFSQVESDLADVRLNARFAFQFTERRPFFLDGIDLYRDVADTLYSRSIAEPVYGVKLSGREGPLSIGLLHALDQSPLPSVHERGAPGFDEDAVADRWAQDTLARLKLDAFGEGWLGLTLADKRIVGSPSRSGPGGAHDSASADLGVPFADRWLAQGSTSASLTTNGEATLWGSALSGTVFRSSGLGTGGGVEGLWRSGDFRQELGFLNQSGLVSAEGWLDHTFTTEGPISTLTPQGFAGVWQEDDTDHFYYLGARQELLIQGIHELALEGGANHRRQDGAEVPGYWLSGSWFGQIGSLIELSPWVSTARSLDFGTLEPANTQDAGLSLTLRSAGARLDTELSGSRHVPDGLDPELAHLLRTTFTWQWSRTLGARLLLQESQRRQAEDTAQELLISPLLTWLDVPGTAAHLGWTERIDLRSGNTTERIAFAKLSLLLRP